ncbi:MAG: acyl-CoA thioesterase II [Beijerinckiaceae bacterium]|nr:acyl-CoA thioesterase II [Beijerinckiaceae bacterium]
MSPIATLLHILDLEQLDTNLWRGISPDSSRYRVFGGQVIAQSLVAAMRSVENRPVHSLHGYFMLGGDPTRPILYEVDRIRDGRSFTTRRVRAIQNGESIFAMMASFQSPEGGLHHAMPMPDVPPPEALPDEEEIRARFVPHLTEIRQRYWKSQRAIELRPTSPEAYFLRKPGPPYQNVWFRASGILPDGDDLHSTILAYASDMTLLDGAAVAHGRSVIDPEIQAASLDHALWFHDRFRTDDWLLYAQDSPWSGASRGLGRGLIYTRDGRLVASVMQEGLMRLRLSGPSQG